MTDSSTSRNLEHIFDPEIGDRSFPREQLQSTDGVVLTLFDLSTGSHGEASQERPLVLLAHATGMTARGYLPIADRLPSFCCLAPDLRGHGDASSPLGHRYDWNGFGCDLQTVTASETFQRLAQGPVFGFGHSMGGAALLMLEIEQPGTFDAMFLYEPIVLPPKFRGRSEEPPIARSAKRRRHHFPSRAAAYENFSSKEPFCDLHPEALDAYVRYGFSLAADGSIDLKLPGAEEASIYASNDHKTFESLPSILCPVQIAHGKLDAMQPSHLSQVVAAELSNGESLGFPELGHFGPLEQPEVIANAAARFFESNSD